MSIEHTYLGLTRVGESGPNSLVALRCLAVVPDAYLEPTDTRRHAHLGYESLITQGRYTGV